MNPEEDPWAVRQEIVAKLSESYPTFNVWITEKTWWATRRTPALPPNAIRHGLYMTVAAETPEELKQKIDEQIERWERAKPALGL